MTLTDEWVELFDQEKLQGKRHADSIFWRLAITHLPHGVDGEDIRVIAARSEIKAQQEERAKLGAI